MRKIISDYPDISEFSGGVKIDYTDAEPTNYGLSSSGDQLIQKDILDNETRRHNFVLYAVNQAFNDYDRLANSNFLLNLSYWLENQANDQEVTAGSLSGTLKKLSCANGMLYSIPNGNIEDGVMYQIQIYADYFIESE